MQVPLQILFLPQSEMAYRPDLYLKISMVNNQQLVTKPGIHLRIMLPLISNSLEEAFQVRTFGTM